MKSNTTLPDAVDLFSADFHPTQTLKGRVKKFMSALVYLTLLMLFVLGLPAVSLAAMNLLPRLLGR
jgi:diacylglycerol kinase